MKLITFDLGGTLMEYEGMPHSWVDYYEQGFRRISEDSNCCVSDQDIVKSIDIMTSFNARVNYREIEYTPEYILERALEHWNVNLILTQAINSFFSGMNLSPKVYNDSIPSLIELKKKGFATTALTDLPTAMPDELFKKDISSLLTHIDFYVSSLSCGHRKPNKAGLQMIAYQFDMPIEDIIFVGDEEKDKLTALNAGCKFICIDRKSLHSCADIRNMDELLHILL